MAPHILEITKDKKVVWTYSNFKDIKTISTSMDMNQPLESKKVMH
jgi:hypothetical protein